MADYGWLLYVDGFVQRLLWLKRPMRVLLQLFVCLSAQHYFCVHAFPLSFPPAPSPLLAAACEVCFSSPSGLMQGPPRFPCWCPESSYPFCKHLWTSAEGDHCFFFLRQAPRRGCLLECARPLFCSIGPTISDYRGQITIKMTVFRLLPQ